MSGILGYDQSGLDRSAAGLALRFHELGIEGEWCLDFEHPTRFRFDRWLSPPCTAVRVAAAGNAVALHHRSGAGDWKPACFAREGDRWISEQALELPVFSWRGRQWPILVAECITSDTVAARLSNDEAYSLFDPDFAADYDLMARDVAMALDLIAAQAPVYVDWITRAVTNLLILRDAGGGFNSTTAYLAPGVVASANHDDPVLTAEMLVHEASHQYLYALARLGAVDDGTDEALYFSPFKNADRPLMLIVLTYHAFGNVLLFYRMLRGAVPERLGTRVDLEERIRWLEKNLAVIEAPLAESRSLTPIGRGLWESVYQQLHSRSGAGPG